MFTSDPRLLALRDSLPGQVLRGSGRVQYHIRERIGEGGQGWVYTANWDEPGGFVVIVKVLRPDAVNADTMRRFQREADVLRMLSQQGQPNPYIVRFYDHATAVIPRSGGEPFTLPFTVMEYVNGTTLERVLDSQPGKGLPVERVRRLLRQVSQALEIVHAKKVIHRDLKPSNILLATDAGAEVAKVTDFGLVKLVAVGLARTATLAGASLGYAPPEQYEQGNARVGERTDVFSLAAIAYEMLAGKMAFPYRDGENPLLIVTRIMNEARPQLARNAEGLSSELRARPDLVSVLDTQLGRALSADPGARHASVTDFFSAIEPLLRAATEPRRASAPPAVRALPFSETVPASMSSPQVSLRESQVPLIIPASGAASQGAMSADVLRPSGPSPVPYVSVSPNASSSEHAVRTRGDTSNPAFWTWRVITPPIKPDVLRAASFLAGGQIAAAVGPTGLARWERGQWVGVPLPVGLDPGRGRGVLLLRDGTTLLYGDGGLLVRISAAGAFEQLTLADPQATLHGAFADGASVTVVGDRPARGLGSSPDARVGFFVQYQGPGISVLADVPSVSCLRAVTRLASGALLAVGDRGALVRIEGGAASYVGSLCNGDLYDVAPMPDGGAVTVGTGGHALAISPAMQWHLEAVQTTADLTCACVTDDGTPWAGAQKARIVRRTGDSWVRMSAEVGVQSPVRALWAAAHIVRGLCDDGAVIEGRLP